ncbi:MAG: type II toxin-antitoxin system RelB/DinJ family antitoxin [Clostridia bacterium]|nr:type II toxin-antitoxin system RelB/DinJ family antitoxin [Clostridia bacterium]
MKSFDIDPALYEEAESILNKLGLPMDTALTLFLRQVVLHNGLPFSVTLPAKTGGSVPAETDEEGESYSWMGELFEELLKETEAVKEEFEQDGKK